MRPRKDHRVGGPAGPRDSETEGYEPRADPREELPAGDPEQIARLILLRRLESAPRTRAELAATLAQRRVPEDVAERVLDRFVEVGLIDDPLFARMWVQSRQSGRLLSRRALRQELTRRGVQVEDVDSALSSVSDDQERAAARQLAERKARSTDGLPYPVRERRLAGVLARRGYSPGLVHTVVREVLEADSFRQEVDWDPTEAAGGRVEDQSRADGD